ncbi:MAG: universal stress protein [Acidobacteria bacterium]|nr:universal stress protein [Acidobacteriota bacterium]
MLQINTILAPVDFSEFTDAQGAAAVNLARHFGSKVVLLHVIPMFGYPHPADATAAKAYEREFESEIRAGVEQALTDMAGRLSLGSEAERVVRKGDPAEQIYCAAKQCKADLVVLPTAGRGVFRQSSIGSVTRKALLDLDCPVMTGVHAKPVKEDAEHPYRRIGWLATLEPGDDRALAWARDFAAAYDAELVALYALPWLTSLGKDVPEQQRAEMTAHARERIHAVMDQAGVDLPVNIRLAHFEDALRELIQVGRPEVIVTNRHRADASVDVTDTVRLSPIPVISV